MANELKNHFEQERAYYIGHKVKQFLDETQTDQDQEGFVESIAAQFPAEFEKDIWNWQAFSGGECPNCKEEVDWRSMAKHLRGNGHCPNCSKLLFMAVCRFRDSEPAFDALAGVNNRDLKWQQDDPKPPSERAKAKKSKATDEQVEAAVANMFDGPDISLDDDPEEEVAFPLEDGV